MKNLTNHAEIRLMERGIKIDDIKTVTTLAKPIFRTGIKFYYLREKDIPVEFRNESNFQKLIGTIVLVSIDGFVITSYRNKSKKAIKKIMKKNKRRQLCTMI